MVKLHSSEMFIKDPADVWGNEQTIGLAELAARTHAPPMTFARSGNVLAWDDFESSTIKYISNATGAGTVARSNAYSEYGSFSTELVTGANLNDIADIQYRLTDYHLGTIGCQCAFSSPSDKYKISVVIDHYDGTNINSYISRWTQSTGAVAYKDDAGLYQAVSPTVKQYNAVKNWGTVQMSVDLSSGKYVGARAFRQEYDLSTFGCEVSLNAAIPHVVIGFRISNEEALAKTAYVDSVIMVENL